MPRIMPVGRAGAAVQKRVGLSKVALRARAREDAGIEPHFPHGMADCEVEPGGDTAVALPATLSPSSSRHGQALEAQPPRRSAQPLASWGTMRRRSLPEPGGDVGAAAIGLWVPSVWQSGGGPCVRPRNAVFQVPWRGPGACPHASVTRVGLGDTRRHGAAGGSSVRRTDPATSSKTRPSIPR
jgi:hypothetical protein